MRKIADLMTRGPLVIDVQNSLHEASERMRQFSFRHLPVIEGSRLVGLLTRESLDLYTARRPGIEPERVLVEDAMVRDPFTVAPDADVAHVAAAMAERRLDAAVVVGEGRVLGVFTTTDALRTLVEIERSGAGAAHGWPRKILCPIDFSEGSRAAVTRALDLARASGAEVTLLHVYELPAPSGAEAVVTGAGALDRLQRDQEHAMRAWEGELRAPGGPVLHTDLALGASAETIVDRARRGGFDLIVLGTHGRTGFKRLVLGSVTEDVTRRAPCPVLVVRRGDEES